MVMKSIFSTPGKLTQPAQPTVQAGPTVKTAPNMGTPNTPKAPNWQRGVTGMDRVNTVPGGVQSLYRPPQQGVAPTMSVPPVAPTAPTPRAPTQPMWNGKPVQTGAYVAPSWKQPVAPPPAAAAPPPVTPPPATTTTGAQPNGGINPAVQAEIDRVRGFLGPQWTPDEAWIQNITSGLAQQNPLATALGNYGG